MPDDHMTLDERLAGGIAKIGSADVVVGIPSFRNAATIGHVAATAAKGLRAHFPDARVAIIFDQVGEQCERGHHRYQMKKEDDVASKRIGHFLALVHFEVIPHALIQQPEAHSGKHQNPEASSAAAGIAGGKNVGQKRARRDQEQSSTDPIAGNGQGVAAWNEERRADLSQQQ